MGVPELPSAGKKTTRIFFSSIISFAVFSTFCHYFNQRADHGKHALLAYNSCDTAQIPLRRNSNGLNEEFVTASSVWRRVFSHRLEKHCNILSAEATSIGCHLRALDFDFTANFDPACPRY